MSGFKERIAGADYSAGAIPAVKLTEKERSLVAGGFYWVRVAVHGVADQGEWQPARFTGIDFSSRLTWDYIGEESASGHHHIEVVEVGDMIVRSEKP